jgi:EAL and modified HD-GYP domain-containing signal transduction protein
MATNEAPGARQDNAGSDPDSALRYVARQPILDLQGKIYGYELLFRHGAETAFSGDGEFATRTMIDNTVLFGLEKLTGSLPAFVNCTAEALIRGQVGLLPPSMTVLEILETAEPVPELIQACRHLKSLGFRLALDDFVWKPSLEPLIQIVDYIKFDFMLSGERERGEMLARLEGVPVILLAEKVETQRDYQRASAEGFTLFQGYYFCRPTLLTRRKVPANQISHIEVLRLLQQTPLDVPRASEAVKRDAALTYRLLRLVNSPACAMRQEVRSISAALMALGEDVFRRIATLAIASELNSGQPAEILRMAFVRARFCELAAAACGLNTLEQYLMGMFSMLPAMLRAPMEEILSALPLRTKIRSALLGEPNPERALLAWLEANEQGDWQTCDAVAREQRLDPQYLHRSYTDALVWAELSLSGSITKTVDPAPTNQA